MSDPFSIWYSSAALKADDELIQQRRSAVDSVGQGMTPTQALDLVRMSCGVSPLDAAYAQGLPEAYQGQGSEIVGMHELRLLSGVTIALRLSEPVPSAAAITAGLALQVASFDRREPQPSDLYEIARAAISNFAIARRSPGPPSIESAPRRKQGEAIADFASAEAAIGNVYTEMGRLTRELKSVVEFSALNQLVTNEKVDILWWLYGQRSLTLNAPLKDCQSFVATAAVAIELAGLTRFVPGPMATSAF